MLTMLSVSKKHDHFWAEICSRIHNFKPKNSTFLGGASRAWNMLLTMPTVPTVVGITENTPAPPPPPHKLN